MTEVLRLTNSECAQWRMCRRSWYLGTYRSLRPKRAHEHSPGSALGMGTRVHDALAEYYVVDGHAPGDPLAFLAATYAQLIADDPIGEDEWRKEQNLTTAMVEGYLEWLAETGEDMDLKVLAPESKIEVPLIVSADGEVLATLLSKIDARVERYSDGSRLALEHKTCGSLTMATPLLQADTQLLTEHLCELLDLKARGEDINRRADGVLYNKLRKVLRTAKAKPPFYGREDVTHNIHELRAHHRHMVAWGSEILAARARLDAGESHHTVCPPNPTRDLTWRSPFFRMGVYEMMDDGSDWEQSIADNFETYDPLQRYENVGSYDEIG